MELSCIIPSNTLRRLNPHLFGTQNGELGTRNEGPSRVETRNGERATRNGAEREASLHEAVFDECRRRCWIALHGSMAERTCRTLGEPDFVILADGGRVLLVECKSRTGKLSPAQFALKHHAEKLGHTVHVVRSLEDFLKLL